MSDDSKRYKFAVLRASVPGQSEEIAIEGPLAPVEKRAMAAIRAMYVERGRMPSALLLGWETWVQLGLEIGDRWIDTLEGVPIVVDDSVRQCLRALPALLSVRYEP